MHTRLRRAARWDRGASAVEYGLLVAAVAAVIVVATFGLGRLVSAAFARTCSAVASSITPVDGGTCGDPDSGAPTSTGTSSDPAGVDPVPDPVPVGG